jgi:hypothetical protein
MPSPDNADLFLRTAALKVISDYTKARYNEAREEVAKQLNKGDRKTVRSPLGDVKVGQVWVTDPKPECTVTDRSALTDWLAEHYPATTKTGYEVIGSDAEIIAVLFEHAPHLLREVRAIDPDQLRELKANSVALGAVIGPGGETDIPGIEVKEPDGVVTCKPDSGGLQAVMDLYRAGRLDLDGTVRPELEAADE